MPKDRECWLIEFNYTMDNYKLLVPQMTLGRIWFLATRFPLRWLQIIMETMKQRVSKIRRKCGKVLEAWWAPLFYSDRSPASLRGIMERAANPRLFIFSIQCSLYQRDGFIVAVTLTVGRAVTLPASLHTHVNVRASRLSPLGTLF